MPMCSITCHSNKPILSPPCHSLPLASHSCPSRAYPINQSVPIASMPMTSLPFSATPLQCDKPIRSALGRSDLCRSVPCHSSPLRALPLQCDKPILSNPRHSLPFNADPMIADPRLSIPIQSNKPIRSCHCRSYLCLSPHRRSNKPILSDHSPAMPFRADVLPSHASPLCSNPINQSAPVSADHCRFRSYSEPMCSHPGHSFPIQ
jgi:hypothetical protein